MIMKTCKELDFILNHRRELAQLERLSTSMLYMAVPAGFRCVTDEERLQMRSLIQSFTNLLNDLTMASPVMPSIWID